MQVSFTVEKETKNTVRFSEDEDGQPAGHPGAPVVGTLYIQKFAFALLGKPEHLTVSIEAG